MHQDQFVLNVPPHRERTSSDHAGAPCTHYHGSGNFAVTSDIRYWDAGQSEEKEWQCIYSAIRKVPADTPMKPQIEYLMTEIIDKAS